MQESTFEVYIFKQSINQVDILVNSLISMLVQNEVFSSYFEMCSNYCKRSTLLHVSLKYAHIVNYYLCIHTVKYNSIHDIHNIFH